MNEATLTQLKIIVERAVRPVRVSIARKRRMREELLSHVVGVFEEEAARLGDEQSALARTRERFGQAAELTGQLQESVPPSDRVDQFAENLFGDPDPSALRLAAVFAAVFGAISFVPFGITILIHGRLPPAAWVLPLPYLWPPLFTAFLAFCGTLLIQGMRQALFGPAGRSWLRAGLVAAAAWIVIPVTAFAISLAVTADIQRILWEFVVPFLPINAVAPVALVASVLVFDSEWRHDREWARLDIAEGTHS
jgi:ATP-dependent Clp protease ATP-binding subunit ClpC